MKRLLLCFTYREPNNEMVPALVRHIAATVTELEGSTPERLRVRIDSIVRVGGAPMTDSLEGKVLWVYSQHILVVAEMDEEEGT